MKKILLIIILVISVIPVFSQATQGTRVTAPVVPNDSSDVYPTHDDYFGAGGFRVVNTITEMINIPVLRKKIGMLVYVKADSTLYQLKTNGYTVFSNTRDSINNLKVTQKLTVQALGGAYQTTFPFQVSDSANYNRLAISSKGLLIAGRQHNSTVNVDGLAMIGAKNSLQGINSFAIGKNVAADNDSTFCLGIDLTAPLTNTVKVGYGSNYMTFDKDSIRFFGKYKSSLPNVNNGLSVNSNTVELGGNLTKGTLINMGSNALELSNFSQTNYQCYYEFSPYGLSLYNYRDNTRKKTASIYSQYTSNQEEIAIETDDYSNGRTNNTIIKSNPYYIDFELNATNSAYNKKLRMDSTGIYYITEDTSLFTDFHLISKHYFIDQLPSKARSTILTGFSSSNSAIASTDNILQAFGKTQGQFDAGIHTAYVELDSSKLKHTGSTDIIAGLTTSKFASICGVSAFFAYDGANTYSGSLECNININGTQIYTLTTSLGYPSNQAFTFEKVPTPGSLSPNWPIRVTITTPVTSASANGKLRIFIHYVITSLN
jgi:hypothetical protein